jgi:hypothetical protein
MIDRSLMTETLGRNVSISLCSGLESRGKLPNDYLHAGAQSMDISVGEHSSSIPGSYREVPGR